MLHRNIVLLHLLSVVAVGCDANATHPGVQPYATNPRFQQAVCAPDGDGSITAAELKPMIGAVARYRLGRNRAIDLAGQPSPDGSRRWDWLAANPQDEGLGVTAAKLDQQWYAAQFPGGQFTVPFDAAGEFDAVYAHDAAALWLLGLASREEHPQGGQTRMRYETPVAVFQFPLQVGAAWTSVGVVKQGVLRGLPYVGQDTYAVTVDASGTVLLPDLTVSGVLRVRTKLTTVPIAGPTLVQHQMSLVYPCLGEVARAVAPMGQDVADFATATELRKLGL
jgi:hypothetical protein